MPSTISAGTTAGTAIAVAGDTTGNLAFQTNGTTTAMTITTAQNVGIGTTSPSTKLNVVSTGNDHLLLRNPTGTSYTTLRLYNDQNDSFRALEIDYSGSTYSGPLIGGGPTGESACVVTTGAYPLALGTNNTARMIIASGGQVTMPAQPMCSVYSTTGVITGSVGTVLPFNVEQVDVGGHYNTSTYRFTAPVAGKYFATLWLLGRNSTSAYSAGLYKNGSQVQGRGAYIEAGSGNEVQGLQTLIIDCAASDFIDARITQTGNGDMFLQDLGGMQIFLIG